MPADVVKSLADKSGESIKKVEDLFNKAQKIVKDEYNITKESDKFYPLVTGILKKMLKITTEESDGSITTTSMGGANAQHSKYMGMVKRNDKKKKKNEGFIGWLHKGD